MLSLLSLSRFQRGELYITVEFSDRISESFGVLTSDELVYIRQERTLYSSSYKQSSALMHEKGDEVRFDTDSLR